MPAHRHSASVANRSVSNCSVLICGAMLLAIAMSSMSCASGPSVAPDLNAAFRQIQLEEATIARADRAAADCAQACAAEPEAQAASDRLCATARKLTDPDALTRCQRAQDQTAALRLDADQRCECAASSTAQTSR